MAKLVIVGLLLSAGVAFAAGPDAETIRKIPARVLPEGESLRNMLSDDVRLRLRQANERSNAAWRKIQSRADWEKHRDECIAALKKSLGEQPERTPLNVRVRGVIEEPDYKIEKLTYESRPGVVVTANLYRPTEPREKMPGILLSHSHHSPKSQGELQDMGALWARAGCYVLVPDHLGHGERNLHGFTSADKYPEKFAVGRQDYYFRYNLSMQLDVAGESLMGWMAWDLSRGIDVLLEQKGIDPEKIILLGGVAGGGDPAGVTAAIDTRISCVVPFNFGGPQPETKYPLPDDAETKFNYAGSGGWESTRNLRGSAAGGFLPWVIVGSVAPRRLIHAHEFSWDGERDPVWKRYQKIFGFYDAADNLAVTHGYGVLQQSEKEASHCGNIGKPHRVKIHAAFAKWFGIKVDESVPIKRRTAAELRCLGDDEKLPSVLTAMGKIADEQSQTFRKSLEGKSPEEKKVAVRKAWARLLGDVEPYVIATKEPVKRATIDDVNFESWLLESERRIKLPLILVRKKGTEGRRLPTVVVIAEHGKEAFLKEQAEEIVELLNHNAAVCLVDVRGTGESSPGKDRGRRSEATDLSSSEQMLGETSIGNKVKDLRSVLAWLRRQPNIDARRFAVWGHWQAGEDFLFTKLPTEMPLELTQPPPVQSTCAVAAFLVGVFEDLSPVVWTRGLTEFRSLLQSPFVHLPHDAVVPGAAAIADLSLLQDIQPLYDYGLYDAQGGLDRTHVENNPRRPSFRLLAHFDIKAPDDPPSVILHNGKIVTVDRPFSIAQAIAIVNGRIVAVGPNDDILKLKGEKTQLIDLNGKTVLPGLIDSHTHPAGAAMHEFDHPIPEMETIADVLAYVKSRAEALPEGKWISVRQIFITRLKEPRWPTKKELDEVAPKHPVVFSTGPDAMLNSLALSKSGIDRNLKTTGTAVVDKDANGEPTGLLRNAGRYIKSESSGRSATSEERQERLQKLFADYNSVGLTTIADRNAGGEDLARYQQLLKDEKLSVRIAASAAVDGQGKTDDALNAIRDVARHPLRAANSQLRIVGIKTFLDGGMLTGSAYMREPWGVSSIYSITDPEYRGILFIDNEKLESLVRACVENDLQFTAHSVGDGAVHSLLNAYAKVNETIPVKKTRPCLTHSNFMSREAVEQMVKLGVVADIQPAWLYLDARVLTQQFGEKRLRYFQPLKTIFDQGAIAGGGSDHMQKIGSLRSINPYNPFLGMWVAITRQARWFEGKLHEEEALTREQAIRFYTANNAYICFLDHEVGSLEPDKAADLIVVDRDLLTCPVDDIRDTKVLKTMLNGKWVYEAK